MGKKKKRREAKKVLKVSAGQTITILTAMKPGANNPNQLN
ncbi:hypothetical protein EPIR_2211 [Erwinia piriflorinigrans CFBP 5888]|uniref:Uncharacterized protein n=1 Tax=Erwinia piriflorinigrans CFBP 5888 TaxID=1161919 RepID=V5Z976_9GAMM|nr:hypothetical protein EPIR_2211 [Erwinia piriflorinigrans CFBP 5888]